MIKFVNHIYSNFIRVNTNDKGEYPGYANRLAIIMIVFGLGGILNLLLYGVFQNPNVMILGMIISPVIWFLWYLLIGFEYLKTVKLMSKDSAYLIFILIISVSGLLFFAPILLDHF